MRFADIQYARRMGSTRSNTQPIENNEKMTRSSIKPTVVGTAKVMNYEDILAAQEKREAKESSNTRKVGGPNRKRQWSTGSAIGEKRTKVIELKRVVAKLELWG